MRINMNNIYIYKALILGTSNSITKDGYGSLLVKDSNFKRCSIGDTTSLSAVYNILKLENLNNYKYAILDFNVNEVTFMLSFNYPFKWVVSTFSFTIKKLLENNVLPIVVSIYKDGYTWLESYQQKIADYFNFPFIDLKNEMLNYHASAYSNDTVHYIKDIQIILANKIRATICDYEKFTQTEFDCVINLMKSKIPAELYELNFYTLNSQIIKLQSNDILPEINVHNSLVDLSLYELKDSKISFTGNGYLCGLAYWSDSYTSYIKIKSNNRILYKNLHNKSQKPILVVRSIGYSSDQFFCQYPVEVNCDNEISKIKNLSSVSNLLEYTHNSVDNDSVDKHLLFDDFIFSNINLNVAGANLVQKFNLYDCENKYSVWYKLKSKNLNINRMKLLDQIKSIHDYLCSPEWCFYVCKFERKNLRLVNAIKLVQTDCFYFYTLVGQFLCTELNDKILYFKKALSLCPNDFSTAFLIAETYYKFDKFEESLSSINNCLLLKPESKKALDFKEIVISKLSSKIHLASNETQTKEQCSETEPRKNCHSTLYTNNTSLDLSKLHYIYIDKYNAQASKKYLNFAELKDLFANNNKIKVNFDDLSASNIPFLFNILVDNVELNCLFIKPENTRSDKLFVSFTSGHRSDYEKDIFIRCKYSRWVNEYFLCIDDPSVFINKKFTLSTPTWYIGDNEHDVYKSMIKLIKKIIYTLNIKASNVFFYGSSVGGYAALFSSYLLDGSNAIALSPQIKPSVYESYNKFAKDSNVDLSNENDRRSDLSPLIKSSNSNFFIVFNDINKSDVKQVEILSPINSIPLGVSVAVNISNVIFWRHSTAAANTHNANPEQFGLVIIEWLLNEKRCGRDINNFNSLSLLINEIFSNYKLIEREFLLLKNQES